VQKGAAERAPNKNNYKEEDTLSIERIDINKFKPDFLKRK
jgi:hypothetical protein